MVTKTGLDIRKILLMEKVVKNWNGLPKLLVEECILGSVQDKTGFSGIQYSGLVDMVVPVLENTFPKDGFLVVYRQDNKGAFKQRCAMASTIWKTWAEIVNASSDPDSRKGTTYLFALCGVSSPPPIPFSRLSSLKCLLGLSLDEQQLG
ncbi:hypothetical protein BTVI_95646 [Pitangus sulphuratus]|nr:hypothetical protein BTVI_95646 [Pitangus sulphuratus]